MFDKVLIGWYHARYHKNLKKAEAAKDSKDLYKFKKYIYKAEDAWKKIITINSYGKKSNNRRFSKRQINEYN